MHFLIYLFFHPFLNFVSMLPTLQISRLKQKIHLATVESWFSRCYSKRKKIRFVAGPSWIAKLFVIPNDKFISASNRSKIQ